MEAKEVDQSLYPSVDLAFDFVKPSYDWMLSRVETINGKIQNLITLAASLTIAVPVFVKAVFASPGFNSPFFIAALCIFLGVTVFGVIGTRMGTVLLPHPGIFYKEYLSFDHWTFQQTALYWAGEAFSKNKRLVERKGMIRDMMSLALMTEIICLVLWVVI